MTHVKLTIEDNDVGGGVPAHWLIRTDKIVSVQPGMYGGSIVVIEDLVRAIKVKESFNQLSALLKQ